MNKKCMFCDESVVCFNMCEIHNTVFREELNKIQKDLNNNGNNNSCAELKGHFHNLRYSAIRCVDYLHFVCLSIRLLAIAHIYKSRTEDELLIAKFKNFLAKYLLKKKIIFQDINDNYNKYIMGIVADIDFRDKWPRIYACDDGHYVRSLSEMLIDNWLNKNNIKHEYEKLVEIPNLPNITIVCDFYLPDKNIYIEYWGKYDEAYIARKHAKKKIYKENNINLIELDYNTIKDINKVLGVLK
jgi:hypothetical protein